MLVVVTTCSPTGSRYDARSIREDACPGKGEVVALADDEGWGNALIGTVEGLPKRR